MLNPQFVMEMANMISTPHFITSCAVHLFFPDIGEEFVKWQQLQMQPNLGDAYDWLQKKFPTALERQAQDRPDELFREMLKHIVAKALELEYKTQPKIALH